MFSIIVRGVILALFRACTLPSCFNTVRLGRTLRLESLFSSTGRESKISLAKLAKCAKKRAPEDPFGLGERFFSSRLN
ncbi:MAG: hypothetical protein KZQ99_18790 [Candidatus Thiodiazotropha sp. (ex Dulcina madagascariensis)]|nr:hypothetical protein [Candidatus Thiodiazotropha sp. (ex Dulcina madagascariensis)]